MIKQFHKEVVHGHTTDEKIIDAFIKFMHKHGEKCKGPSWKSQYKYRIRRYASGDWGTTAKMPTISMKDFLAKYTTKRISLKAIL